MEARIQEVRKEGGTPLATALCNFEAGTMSSLRRKRVVREITPEHPFFANNNKEEVCFGGERGLEFHRSDDPSEFSSRKRVRTPAVESDECVSPERLAVSPNKRKRSFPYQTNGVGGGEKSFSTLPTAATSSSMSLSTANNNNNNSLYHNKRRLISNEPSHQDALAAYNWDPNSAPRMLDTRVLPDYTRANENLALVVWDPSTSAANNHHPAAQRSTVQIEMLPESDDEGVEVGLRDYNNNSSSSSSQDTMEIV